MPFNLSLNKFNVLFRELLVNSRLYKSKLKYNYNFHPKQLVLFCNLLKEVSNLDGSIIEIGCANGITTVFLNKYLESLNSNKTYFALDTFNGFTKNDILYEENNRKKKKSIYKNSFAINSLKLFKARMSVNNIKNVTPISCDANQFQFADIAPFSFVILDVDLYKPIKNVLDEIFPLMTPGGIILVDDCNKKNFRWDGAYAAFTEFTSEKHIKSEIILDKIGLIRIPE